MVFVIYPYIYICIAWRPLHDSVYMLNIMHLAPYFPRKHFTQQSVPLIRVLQLSHVAKAVPLLEYKH